MAKTLIRSVKGMRDFYPENWAFQKWLSENWLKLGNLYGYQEYEGPIVEPIELYLEKTSEEIVTQQTFTMPDRDGNKLVMRPELTPTFARMVAQKENQLTVPIRWQSYGRFFRYEKPQRGRGRSFFQWNIDVIGSDSYLADAEILTIACYSLKKLGITPEEAVIKVSDRQAMHHLLTDRLGISEDLHVPLFRLIDRIDKMPKEKFIDELKNIGLFEDQISQLFEILEIKDPSFSDWLQSIFEVLKLNGVSEYVEVDLKIIRGFDYYTKTVFEAWAKTSLKRALFGGGRYDNLTQQIGGKKKLPGVGFAVGDMAIYELLTEVGKMPNIDANQSEILVTIFNEDLTNEAISIANILRENGIKTELILEINKKLKKQFAYADKKNIQYVIVLGEDEIKEHKVVLKDLSQGTQETISVMDVITKLSK